MKTAAALALVALSLAGCTRDTTAYPSLAPRAVEQLGFAEPEVPIVEAKPDPALDARIVALGRSLDGTTTGFTADAAKAETAGARARGKPVGSDAWLDAQTALAQLDDWRAQTSSLLTDADGLASDRAAPSRWWISAASAGPTWLPELICPGAKRNAPIGIIAKRIGP